MWITLDELNGGISWVFGVLFYVLKQVSRYSGCLGECSNAVLK